MSSSKRLHGSQIADELEKELIKCNNEIIQVEKYSDTRDASISISTASIFKQTSTAIEDAVKNLLKNTWEGKLNKLLTNYVLAAKNGELSSDDIEKVEPHLVGFRNQLQSTLVFFQQQNGRDKYKGPLYPVTDKTKTDLKQIVDILDLQIKQITQVSYQPPQHNK